MDATTKRLEEMLRVWESYHFTLNALSRIQVVTGRPQTVPLVGPVALWDKLRAHLLKAMDEHNDDVFFDEKVARFILQDDGSNFYTMMPLAFANWMRRSRRIYHIGAELEQLMLMTSLRGITWGDVSLPFEAFAITLEVPISDRHGTEYDCILVDASSKSNTLIYVFSRTIAGTARIDSSTRDQVYRLIRQEKIGKAVKVLKKLHKHKANVGVGRLLSLDITQLSEDIGDITSKVQEISDLNARQELDDAMFINRVVVSLCMYLKSMPPGSDATRERAAHAPRSTSGGSTSADITDEVRVCEVLNIYPLNTQEQRELSQTKLFTVETFRELSAHFRAGHWRRPPGRGDDPTAPKTVHVRPTIVRAEKREHGTLLGGLQQVLN